MKKLTLIKLLLTLVLLYTVDTAYAGYEIIKVPYYKMLPAATTTEQVVWEDYINLPAGYTVTHIKSTMGGATLTTVELYGGTGVLLYSHIFSGFMAEKASEREELLQPILSTNKRMYIKCINKKQAAWPCEASLLLYVNRSYNYNP